MAASQSRSRPLTLDDLPDDALVACFAQLQDPLERRRLLPPVCRRWRRLADSPRLLCSFDLAFKGARLLPCLAALRGWLERNRDGSHAGAAVRSLRLFASRFDNDAVYHFSAADLQQLRRELLLIAAACSGLQELRVETRYLALPDTAVGSLAGAAPGLRLLYLRLLGTRLLADAPLGALSQLCDLRLSGNPIRLHPSTVLPPSLTRLRLEGLIVQNGVGHHALPQQVVNLPQLLHLHLRMLNCQPDGFSPLSRLTRLTALRLSHMEHLPQPEVLRALTNLMSLCIDADTTFDNDEEELVEQVGELLLALPQLSALQLLNTARLPQAMAQLPRLQRLAWHTLGAAGQLPGGPWLASLRKLALSYHVAADNIAVLRQAPRLEYLGLYGGFLTNYVQEQGAAAASSVLEFACQQTSLRCLYLGSVGISKAAAACAEQRAPHLSVSLTDWDIGLFNAVMPEFAHEYHY